MLNKKLSFALHFHYSRRGRRQLSTHTGTTLRVTMWATPLSIPMGTTQKGTMGTTLRVTMGATPLRLMPEWKMDQRIDKSFQLVLTCS